MAKKYLIYTGTDNVKKGIIKEDFYQSTFTKKEAKLIYDDLCLKFEKAHTRPQYNGVRLFVYVVEKDTKDSMESVTIWHNAWANDVDVPLVIVDEGKRYYKNYDGSTYMWADNTTNIRRKEDYYEENYNY